MAARSSGLWPGTSPQMVALQDIRLPTTLGDAYRAAACAWTPCGRFLLTAWQGGMGMLTMHKVRCYAASAGSSCNLRPAIDARDTLRNSRKACSVLYCSVLYSSVDCIS